MRARGELIKSRKRFQNWNFRHFLSFSSPCTGAITWWYFSPMFTRCESLSYKFWLHKLLHCPQTVLLFLSAHYLVFWFWALVTRCFLCLISLNVQYSPLISEHLLSAVTLLLNGNVKRCIVLVVFYFLSFGARWSGRDTFRSTCRGIHLLSWITQVFQTCITL